MSEVCTHRDQICDVTPGADGCEECLALGQTWVTLRLCLSCGHIGCCDASIGKHATAHFAATAHPIISPFGSEQHWMWCYVDEKMLATAGAQ